MILGVIYIYIYIYIYMRLWFKQTKTAIIQIYILSQQHGHKIKVLLDLLAHRTHTRDALVYQKNPNVNK